MNLNLGIEQHELANGLAHEIAPGGTTVVDAIERLLSEQLEDSVSKSFGERIVKVPRAVIHPRCNVDRFLNLAAFSRDGYSTWYPELRFSTHKNDSFKIVATGTSALELGSIGYGGGISRRFRHSVKKLKTQTNHTIRLNKVGLPATIFSETIQLPYRRHEIARACLANLTAGVRHFVDDRIAGFRTVSFDHVVTGERRFCKCHSDAHSAMLEEAETRLPQHAPGSWPRQVVELLQHTVYAEGLCHFCLAKRHGPNEPIERYGDQIRSNLEPYVNMLVRGEDMDRQSARVAVRHRLSISRWVREDEL